MTTENGAFLAALEAWKREVLSPYCLSECQSSCCDLSRVKIDLSREGLVAILGFEPDDASPFETGEEGRYTYHDGFCPRYDAASQSCRIRDHPHRPNACQRYPFDILLKLDPEDRWVAVNPTCEFSGSEGLESLRVLGREYEVDVFVLKPKEIIL